MITLLENENEIMLIAEPNRSASWRLNKIVILVFVCWWSIVSAFFVFLGLWPILPFAGLEVGGLAFALYYVCWKLQHRHVLRICDDQLILQKGAYYPKFSWHFPRSTVSLSVEKQAHPWDPLKLFLCANNQTIPIGNFLNKDDSKKLLDFLRVHGIAVRNYSPLGAFKF